MPFAQVVLLLIFAAGALQAPASAAGSSCVPAAKDANLSGAPDVIVDAAHTPGHTEALTGSRIRFPDDFAGVELLEQTDHRGKIHTALAGAWPDVRGQIVISVREIYAASIADVLQDIVFQPDEVQQYELRELSENTLAIYEEKEAFGERDYRYHQAWLLNDGSYLYVGFSTKLKKNKELYKEIACEPGAGGSPELSLQTVFKYPGGTEAGHWIKEDGTSSLEVYGADSAIFFRLKNESSLKYGYYDKFWKRLRIWNDGVDSAQVSFNPPDEMTLRGEALDGFAGTYARAAVKKNGGKEMPVVRDAFRGQWENDTIYGKLTITRGGVSILTESAQRIFAGHNESEDGLEYDGEIVVRRADGGGLKVQGFEGTFYRIGEGKGVDRYAAFAPFNGNWENPTARLSLQIQGGGFVEAELDSGAVSVRMGGAGVQDGKLYLGDKAAVLDPDSGALSVEGVQGVFRRAAPPEK